MDKTYWTLHDHVIVLGERHLSRLLKSYVRHYQEALWGYGVRKPK